MGHKKLVTENPAAKYPDFLKGVADKQQSTEAQPLLFVMKQKDAAKQLEEFIAKNPDIELIDNYAEQYAELLLSKNAQLYRANYDIQVASISDMLHEHYGKVKPWQLGTWVYFPWLRQLVHILDQEHFEALRTIRNRDLITVKEQEKLFEFDTVCFGMSVGSAGAIGLGISGISRNMTLVDGAVISGSNLNRISTGVASVGLPKANVIARQIYEMNPYSTITTIDRVTKDNIASIFDQKRKIKLAIDEIDDIEMKIQIRLEARKRKIPVIMATELGDTIMLDIERFDLEPNRKLFHNAIPNIEEVANSKIENHREWMKYAVKIIDPSNMPIKMQESLLKIGSTVVTHPQLGSTVMMTGGALAFVVKNIALGNSIESGRYVISFEGELLSHHKSRNYKRAHKKHTKIIKTAIDSM